MYQLKCGGLSPYTLEMWWESEIEAPLIKPSSTGPWQALLSSIAPEYGVQLCRLFRVGFFPSFSDDLHECPIYNEFCIGWF